MCGVLEVSISTDRSGLQTIAEALTLGKVKDDSTFVNNGFFDIQCYLIYDYLE